MRRKQLLSISAAILTGSSLLGYHYLSVAKQIQRSPVPSSQATPIAPHPPAIVRQPAISPQSHLTFQLQSYPSEVLGITRTYGLILPPNYESNSTQQYPVIFLLHGGHGEATDWIKKGNALSVLQKLYTDRRLPPTIIITPDGNDDRGSNPYYDPAYIDGPHGQVLTAIGEELVQVVKTRYRTKPQPQFWAIGGVSSGGWGAVNIGLHKPQNFGILFSHSGYFTDKSGAENSPINYVQQLSAAQQQQFRIYLDAGLSDGKFLQQSRLFHQTLDHLGMSNTFNVFPGGHGVGENFGWHYWHKHLEDSLSYVGDRFYAAESTMKASVQDTSR
jgi:enterochelin esterase-like enzyme